jgi:hypothetical protein
MPTTKGPQFKLGDRVEILTLTRQGSEDSELIFARRNPPQFGTIIEAPKTFRGKKYLVAYDGGYILNGRDCPQILREPWLLPVLESEQVALALSFKMERDESTGQATTVAEFRCPHCKELHKCREVYSSIPANFSIVGYGLVCGYVRVAMPWTRVAE